MTSLEPSESVPMASVGSLLSNAGAEETEDARASALVRGSQAKACVSPTLFPT